MQDFTLYYLFKKMQPNALLIRQNFIIRKKWVLHFVLGFDACIITITWSLLFVAIALWVICPTR
jgi:hypothetical protein